MRKAPETKNVETKNTLTPGPWEIADKRDGLILIRAITTEPGNFGAAYSAPIANVFAEANAQLIAAAPDLLEALTRLANAAGVVGDLDHAGTQVPAEAWAEMYAAHCAARGVIAKTEKGTV